MTDRLAAFSTGIGNRSSRRKNPVLVRLVLLFLFLFSGTAAFSQCADLNPYTINVDLSSSPDATFTSPSVTRVLANCCGNSADKKSQFKVTLHPSAIGIQFIVGSGNDGTFYRNCVAMDSVSHGVMCF